MSCKKNSLWRLIYLYKLQIDQRWSMPVILEGSFETNSFVKVKNDHRSKFSNLSNWKEEAWKNQGFNGIRNRDLRDTGTMLYQLSYEATHWERGQFIEFISPVRTEMMWSIYEIIHILVPRVSLLCFLWSLVERPWFRLVMWPPRIWVAKKSVGS